MYSIMEISKIFSEFYVLIFILNYYVLDLLIRMDKKKMENHWQIKYFFHFINS